MNRRIFGARAMVTALPLLGGCTKTYPPFFDIEWDEEVQMHDGRVIWVHVKRTFERRSSTDQWEGIHRDTEISFDAGGKIGRWTRKFERYDIIFIEADRGNWYFLLGEVGHVKVRLVNEDVPILVLQADGQTRSAKAWQEVPYFPKENLMPVTPGSAGVSHFDRKRLTVSEKLAHWKKYSRGAGDNGTRSNVHGLQPVPER